MIRAERLGDAVFPAEPIAEVDELAASGAEETEGIGVEVVLAPAGGAFNEGGFVGRVQVRVYVQVQAGTLMTRLGG